MSYSELHTPYAYQPNHPDHDPAVNEEIRKHERTWGGYNDLPPGWREITEAEFVKGPFFSYLPTRVEFRQLVGSDIRCERGSPLVDARLFFFSDGTGVALMDDHWAGKVRYFAFGCNHKWREVYGEEAKKLGIGRLYSHDHAYVCDNCGRKRVLDSSG